MDKAETWFAMATERLTDPQNQRVWSVIVSLFGDLAQKPGDRISGGALTRIVQPMGIRPEAMRVALHRLRKDGWIDSSRSGRASVHSLTDYGRRLSAAVTPRIYARTPDVPARWHMLVAEDSPGIHTLDEVLLAENYISLGRNTALGPGPVPGDCADLLALDVSARAVPDWLRSRLFPPELVAACRDLHDAVRAVRAAQPANWRPTPLRIAVLRTLLVHRWRRVVLRHPDLPPVFHPSDWAGPTCRSEVFALLDTLPRPDLARLDSSA
ncbi:transcriptional regulator, PaaX family [Cribrihabitans marinus]|uniref:Transcriptional regulator, PaaX family n=1 Tax=Cribrihabitans marinus TaxID=1227549 RepID=A0A1H6S4X7_9RHOB|nr:PaaX family transcriptional regulator C-terminal domain-containing protein [Cribrihabitans marinus]GGH23964.1 phenylacetic acid degradation operon negative regulatory protein PaaX [Cribrihabitans marinus]SEI62959.1 transcriptional regulator, PaaX family [Cribrihabitans marinus]